ncbi:hypothetical protein SESBI_44684 [Sesbania bispinosa]|nr:hypothetical protein SESBI_44684 [Sesbania bispinosa]
MDIDINIVDEDETNNDEPMDDISDAESQVKGMTDFGMSMEIQMLNRVKQELDKRQRIVHSLHLLKMIVTEYP